MTTRVLVTGAGGFIGHHLVTYLKARGYWVRGVDLKLPEYTEVDADEFELLDLRLAADCERAMRGGIDHVYALAADMGGMGFISAHHAEILHNNALINLHTIEAARQAGRQALPVQLERLHLPRVPADRRERDAPPRGGRLSGPAAGRLRLGEARHREAVRVLLQRLRARDADRPLPQHLRAQRHLRRRPREGARRPQPQDRAASTTAARSRSGATASRPARSATSTTASRGSTG